MVIPEHVRDRVRNLTINLALGHSLIIPLCGKLRLEDFEFGNIVGPCLKRGDRTEDIVGGRERPYVQSKDKMIGWEEDRRKEL